MTAVLSVEAPVSVMPQRRHLRLVESVQQAPVAKISPRVYARRRFAALLVLLVVAGGALMAGKALALGGDGQETVTVKPGESLSVIAHEKLPDMPVDVAVVKFQQTNNLNSLHLDAGEKLLVPAA